jgi:DnaJ-class molecular chaperone
VTYRQDLKALVSRLKQARHHYELLGVHAKSTADELSTARKELAQVLHPDKLIANGIDPGDKKAGHLMAEVNAAYTVLATPALCKRYRAELATGRSKCPTCGGDGCRRKQRGFKAVTMETCVACGGAGLA